MGATHEIMQPFAGRDLHTPFPEYEGWEIDLQHSTGRSGVSTIDKATVLLFFSFLTIGSFATILLVW